MTAVGLVRSSAGVQHAAPRQTVPSVPFRSEGDGGADLLVAALATWRLAHLLVHEDGPANGVVRLRRAVDATPLAGVMDCFGCASVWTGLLVTALVKPRHTGASATLVRGLAASGAAFLAQQALDAAHAGPRAQHPWVPEPATDPPWVTVHS